MSSSLQHPGQTLWGHAAYTNALFILKFPKSQTQLRYKIQHKNDLYLFPRKVKAFSETVLPKPMGRSNPTHPLPQGRKAGFRLALGPRLASHHPTHSSRETALPSLIQRDLAVLQGGTSWGYGPCGLKPLLGLTHGRLSANHKETTKGEVSAAGGATTVPSALPIVALGMHLGCKCTLQPWSFPGLWAWSLSLRGLGKP